MATSVVNVSSKERERQQLQQPTTAVTDITTSYLRIKFAIVVISIHGGSANRPRAVSGTFKADSGLVQRRSRGESGTDRDSGTASATAMAMHRQDALRRGR